MEYRNRLGRQGHRAYLERWCASVVVPGFLEIVRQSAERRKWQDTSGPPDARRILEIARSCSARLAIDAGKKHLRVVRNLLRMLM